MTAALVALGLVLAFLCGMAAAAALLASAALLSATKGNRDQ